MAVPAPAHFRTLQQHYALAADLAAMRPDLLQLYDLGPATPLENGVAEHLVGFRLGRGDAVVGVNQGSHQQETGPVHQMMDFIADTVRHHGTGRNIARDERLEHGAMAGLITMNPTGYVQVQNDLGGYYRLNPNGVNLNRNAPVSTFRPGPQFGPHAASEIETQRFVEFHELIGGHSSFIDSHSYGDVVFSPTHAASEQFARQLAEIDRLMQRRSTDQDPVTGTSAEYFALEKDVPSAITETARTFLQAGRGEYRTARGQNFRMWDRALALAPDTRRMMQAPTMSNVRIDTSTGAVRARGEFPRAWIDTLRADAEIVTRFDAAPGSGISLRSSARDANQDMIRASYSGTIPLAALDSARDGVLWIRGSSDRGEWGALEPIHLAQATKRRS